MSFLLFYTLEVWPPFYGPNSFLLSFLQREKDESVSEMEALKDKFEIAKASQTRESDEKEMITKELDRLLEKYDR